MFATGAFMLWLDLLIPGLRLPFDPRLAQAVGGLIVFCGFAMDVYCLLNFIWRKTSPSPFNPGKASLIVRTGFYRFSRNPMYLGMVIVLAGWAVMLLNPLALVGLPVFVAYINHFQIGPEERALAQRFGDEYIAYTQQVRRWL
jgi:protein-S-isoprenylcysteine O-methyltransferase Ste14